MGSVVDWPDIPPLDTLLRQRWGDDWLVGLDSALFWPQLGRAAHLLNQAETDQGGDNGRLTRSPSLGETATPALLIVEPDPMGMLVSLLAGLWQGYTVVLANPQWGDREMQQVRAIAQPDPEPCLSPWAVYLSRGLPPSPQPEILIATGGTSGHLKFARHSWTTLMASVQGFLAHFGATTVNAYCVLPLYHVSGLMQVLRVLASGGTLVLQPYADLKQGSLLPVTPLPLSPSPLSSSPLSPPLLSSSPHPPTFLSLVPTQLQWLLSQGDPFLPWLQGFRAVLLGGAPPWPTLLSAARSHQIPVALTYGMTETASQVATLRPEAFLAGNTSSGPVLPHAHIQPWDDQGQPLGPGQVGRLAIQSTSLFLGYRRQSHHTQPHPTPADGQDGPSSGALLTDVFLTDDLGYLDGQGYLHLVGRYSTKLITGGEKVFPEEVEAVLLTTGLVQAACVVGLPDDHWGQVVCAAVVPQARCVDLRVLNQALNGVLAAYKRPKVWLLLEAVPMTPQGKINRRQVMTLAQTILRGTI